MSSHASSGFQAVILCGPGTSLHPFTGPEDMPKALLPIANKPMLHYPLEWCEKAGFNSILVLTLAEHIAQIQSYLRSHTFITPIQLEASSPLDDNLGTADVLRVAHRNGWITSDFVVLPCDLVTDIEPEEVMRIWMVDQAGFDGDMGNRGRRSSMAGEDDGGRRGGLGVWYETKGEGAVKGQETDFLAIAPRASRAASSLQPQWLGSLKTLLFNLPSQTGESNLGIPLRQSLLKKHPNFQLFSTRRDSGIYFFPLWVLKFIDRNPKMSSIREDVLPWWSKCCWQNKRLAEKLGLLDILSGGENFTADVMHDVGEMSTTRQRKPDKRPEDDSYEKLPVYTERDLEVMAKAKKGIVVLPVRVPEVPKSDSSSIISPPPDILIPSITAYLPNATMFIRRVDTIQLYLFTSLHLANPSTPSGHPKVHHSASIDPKAYVSRVDCLIAAKVTIAERTTIKRSVLGHKVSIAKGVTLLGCVLMDRASIAEGASLEGCIVGRHAIIGAGAKLKNCQVAHGFIVEAGIQAKNECFVAFDGLDGNYTAAGLRLDGAYDDSGGEADDGEKNEKDNEWSKSCNKTEMDREKHLGGWEGGVATDVDLDTQDKVRRDNGVKETHDKQDNNGQKENQDKINEMNEKLEKAEKFVAEAIYSLPSSQSPDGQDLEDRNKEVVAVLETITASDTLREEAMEFEAPPAKATSAARSWALRLLLGWAVPIVGFGIWCAVVAVVGRDGSKF